ncbi:hypothetical protein ASPZODRAFT_127950 [Penicilliopsis zonata CBS 506.65]|uniref:SMP-30/Gluconolactonase/LRE-like region domain-containing protein n=1 Tax=Penicilliopsis zonata CBS 506.65 TaxID=1073090 RepID=A0A1L9SXE1_9EURO|nr:hypothetical protein ASPZODRAFT_127950 [Penicilliopsis zonata CBS 506.65]OJJ51819.1 hypothetical protein ASPZODRAFT_127950 [Penicilliopsis zonata CBS 506.65]
MAKLYTQQKMPFDKVEVTLLAQSDTADFHEACIYHHPTRSVFVTSNQLQNAPGVATPATANKHVKLFRIYDDGRQEAQEQSVKVEEVTFDGCHSAMLNGGVNDGDEHILLCAQGSTDPSDLSGIIRLPIPTEASAVPSKASVVVDSFYGVPFNSVNDVIVHPEDQSIWFTDPPYGFHQGIRSPPQLPPQVYRFNPHTHSIRALADGFSRPNGLCFSPDRKTLYVTDTGAISGASNTGPDFTRPSSIYAFDIVYPEQKGESHPEPFLVNRRLFAYAAGRFPDGIKCDTDGNVYSGCGDGIQIWNPYGVLLASIPVENGVANFCFGEGGVIYACNETRFYRISLGEVRGDLLRI